MALELDFENLSEDEVVLSYKKTRSRLVLLDYDGTMVPQGVTDKRPTEEVIKILNELCADPSNVVFVISGAGKDELAQWFEPCEKLGIMAEDGYHIRWDRGSPWETFSCNNQIPRFGWMDEPAIVKKSLKFVEVNPQGISKGVAMETLIKPLLMGKTADFVLCIGDDSSDEDMFEAIRNYRNNPMITPIEEVFECTVGNEQSKAKYYLNDIGEVLKMLKALVKAGP